MKKVLLTMIGCLLTVTTTFASPSQNDIAGLELNKIDSSVMFGDEQVEKVVMLSHDEMKTTEGEYLPLWNMAIYGYRAYQFYRAVPYSAKLGYSIGFGWGSSSAW